MFKKLLILFAVMLGISGMAVAQRSLTNADLEKYRDARLRANQDYKENYEKRGMPSPEELARIREDHLYQTSQVAARLRADRLEEERLDFQRYQAELEAKLSTSERQSQPQLHSGQMYGQSLIFPSYGGYFNSRRYGRFGGYRILPQQGYYAGGQFWPTGPATQVRPIIRIGGGGRRR